MWRKKKQQQILISDGSTCTMADFCDYREEQKVHGQQEDCEVLQIDNIISGSQEYSKMDNKVLQSEAKADGNCHFFLVTSESLALQS